MDRISIIGVGLIGSSIGLALKRANLEVEIVGHDKERSVANRSQSAGAVDRAEPNLFKAIEGARVVIVATPIKAIEEVLRLIGPELPEGSIVTDTGSTKEWVLQWAEQHLPRTVSFVGGHPMAGKEVSGPEGAQADLFQDATYCIIPGRHADQEAVRTVVGLVESMGARPYFIDAAEHDSFVGAVSHLPLILSTVLVRVTSKSPSWPEISRLAATGYRDLTRLASGDPEMSRDICLTNQEGLLHWIDEFIKEMYTFRGLVKERGESLWETFDAAWEARDRWMQNKVTAPGMPRRVDTPTTAESMGGILLGDRASGRVREILEWFKDDNKRKRNRSRP